MVERGPVYPSDVAADRTDQSYADAANEAVGRGYAQVYRGALRDLASGRGSPASWEQVALAITLAHIQAVNSSAAFMNDQAAQRKEDKP